MHTKKQHVNQLNKSYDLRSICLQSQCLKIIHLTKKTKPSLSRQVPLFQFEQKLFSSVI